MIKDFRFSPKIIVGLLTVITLAAYWPVQRFEFINLDDDEYVYANTHVTTGLTLQNIVWAFTKCHAANWHPLTWISHMIDCELYGLDAGGHHWTNLILHIINVAFLFFLMFRMTGTLWRSALVAALFAVHPLHVESVAWVAERKDVLSAFFLFLTIGAYFRYTRSPGLWRYSAVVLSFAAGLMVKPMLVTLPALLLIMDFWPLSRIRLRTAQEPATGGPALPGKELSIVKLVMEKIPLFALACASCIVTILVQKSYHAMSEIAPEYRIANVFYSYTSYIFSMIIPRNLCVMYPYELHPSFIASIGSVLFIGAISLFFARKRRLPWLWAGWLWYLCSLVPVIGILQVGMQSRADRYTYVPLIGLFFILAWGLHSFVGKFPKMKTSAIVFACSAIICLAVLAHIQVMYWKDNSTLYTHTLLYTKNNYIIHNNLGITLLNKGRVLEAEQHFESCLRFPLIPVWNSAEYNLGNVNERKGDFKKAIMHIENVMQSDTTYETGYFRLGELFLKAGDDSSSMYFYKKALHFKPDFWEAMVNLGIIMHNKDSLNTAIGLFSEAIRLNPLFWPVHYYSGLSWEKKGDFQRAFIRFLEAIELCKGASMAPYYSLGVLLFKKGKLTSAKGLFSQAIGLAPSEAAPYCARAAVFCLQGNPDSAEADYMQALRLKPDMPEAHKRLADIYEKKGLKDLALFHRKKAMGDKAAAIEELIHVKPTMLPCPEENKK